jgi:hypothetical protein
LVTRRAVHERAGVASDLTPQSKGACAEADWFYFASFAFFARLLVRMRRKTFRQLRAKAESQFHHHVYVVMLDPAVARLRKVRAENRRRDPAKPCVYVGMTGLLPEERFWNHKNGEKAARLVTRYGIKLLPELFAHLNPMPFEAAAQMEKDLAADLRAQGYTVLGGT